MEPEATTWNGDSRTGTSAPVKNEGRRAVGEQGVGDNPLRIPPVIVMQAAQLGGAQQDAGPGVVASVNASAATCEGHWSRPLTPHEADVRAGDIGTQGEAASPASDIKAGEHESRCKTR